MEAKAGSSLGWGCELAFGGSSRKVGAEGCGIRGAA